MKKKMFEFDEEAICVNCDKSTAVEGGDICICALFGAVKADGSCKKFSLDLLKVRPNIRKPIVPQGETNFSDFFEKPLDKKSGM